MIHYYLYYLLNYKTITGEYLKKKFGEGKVNRAKPEQIDDDCGWTAKLSLRELKGDWPNNTRRVC